MVYYNLESFPKGEFCNFCKTRTVDSISLGSIYKTGDIHVHYFCLLLATYIVQRGSDRQGLLGFLPKDIKKELKRGANIKCAYCGTRGATVACANKKCNLNFHLPCGLQHKSLHYFLDDFKSFCYKHREKCTISSSVKISVNENGSVCMICFNSVDVRDRFNLIWPPCCKPTSLLHKKCVQQMAYAAGYYFKCPFCADVKTFYKKIKRLGIFIPEREASWEREPHALRDYRVQLSCQAQHCACPKGTAYSRSGTKWNLESCKFCGGRAIHLACSNIWIPGSEFSLDWECQDCSVSSTTHSESFHNWTSNTNGASYSDSYMTADENLNSLLGATNKHQTLNVNHKTEDVNSSQENILRDYGNGLIFVDGDDLHEKIKDVTNFVEIIINNVRPRVSLTKLNIDADLQTCVFNDLD